MKTRTLSVLCAFTLAFCLPSASAEEGGRYIEEVIVTAEKREENVLEVPVTMTAFSDQMIEELGMTNQFDLEQLVPGLQFGDNGQQVGQGTVIRGIGSRLSGETHSDLAVATYVDGVYTIGNYGVAPNMFDLERVEVARGPQGTLNGRNSIAGAISYYSKRPTDEWDVVLLSEFTDQFTQRYGVAFGGPLIENVSFRITGSYLEGDGAQENIGGEDYDAPDQLFIAPQLRYKTDRMDLNLRYSKLEDDGSPRTQVLLSEVNRTDPDVPSNATGRNNFLMWNGRIPSIPANCPVGRPGWECGDLENKINVNRPGVGGGEAEQLTVSYSFDINDNYTVRYTFGDSDNISTVSRDRDMTSRVGSAADPFLASDAPVPFDDNENKITYEYTETSHEIQLVSNLDGAFNFIVGAFSYENDTTWTIPRLEYQSTWRFQTADEAAVASGNYASCQEMLDTAAGFGIATSAAEAEAAGDPGNFWQCPVGSDHTQTLLFATQASSTTNAVFANGEFEISDQWLVSGGLRYTEDEKNQGFNGGWFKGTLFGTLGEIIFDSSDPETRTWDATIGHVSLEFTPEDNRLIYGRISTGYRAGGFNTASDAVPPLIKEETLINYELGAKGLFMDQRLSLTSGVYFNDFDDYQINGSIENLSLIPDPFADSPVIEFTDNIQGTKIWGAELEAVYYVTDNWRLSGFYAYQDSEIGQHFEIVRGDPNPRFGEYEHLDLDDMGNVVTVTSQYQLPSDMTGNSLPMQPKHKFSLTSAHDTTLSGIGSLQFLATYSWVAERASDLSNLDISTIPAYSRFDVRGTWTSDDETLSATLFVQNVFDEIGVVEYLHISTNSGWPASGTLTDPRRVGLEVRWQPRL